MKHYQEVGCMVLFLVVFFGIGLWWSIYSYHDCLNVGHSKTYCVLHFGK